MLTSGESSHDLALAFGLMFKADLFGSRTEPFRWGTAVFTPEFPRRHDSNFLRVESLPTTVDAAELAAEAERVQAAAGLAHRLVVVPDGATGDRLVPGFEALGWGAGSGWVMAYRRPPDRPRDTRDVVETDAATLRAAHIEQLLTYRWGTPDVAAHLLGVAALRQVPTRYFAIFADGMPVSWAEVYLDDGVAQIEAVATRVAYRGRGLASRVVLHAASRARAAGARLVFLCADALDWPKDLYARLGFDLIGRYAKFVRTAQAPITEVPIQDRS